MEVPTQEQLDQQQFEIKAKKSAIKLSTLWNLASFAFFILAVPAVVLGMEFTEIIALMGVLYCQILASKYSILEELQNREQS